MINASEVSFSYQDDQKKVIDGVNLTINKGEFVAIIGPNGSGKSTLAKLLNGLLLPYEGKVSVDGIDTQDDKRLFDVRKKVGMVFQNPDNQMVATTIIEDVAFGPENLGIERQEIKVRIDQALKDVKMSEYIHTSPYRLSGGQKQRIAIAGILAMRPDVIIFDEATAMLDPKGRAEVLQAIEDLHTMGYTIIHITHFMEEVLKADRLIIMDQGRIIADDKPRSLFANHQLMDSLDFDLPFYAQVSRGIQQSFPDFPMCFNQAELKEALWPYL